MIPRLCATPLRYGCTDAVNHGGGSSMLGIREPKSGKMEIKNSPSDGRERSVANVLGVSVAPKGKSQTRVACDARARDPRECLTDATRNLQGCASQGSSGSAGRKRRA